MGQEPNDTPQDEGPEPEPAPESKATGFDQLPAETQTEIKKLRAEAASNRKAAQEAQAKVEEYESANQSELEKLTGRLTKTEKERDAAKVKLLRFEVAADKQVPAEAIDLLTGDTREELEAKADKLLELVKSRTDTDKKPDFDGGPREPAPDPKRPEDAHNEAVLTLLGIAPNT